VPESPKRFTPFRRDGAYIITGGLGGLGLFLADAMSAAGAGRLILNARSRPTDAAGRSGAPPARGVQTHAARRAPALLRRLISEHLGVILRRTVNPDRSFFDYGLDSLGTSNC
jgi:polyketide synthase 5